MIERRWNQADLPLPNAPEFCERRGQGIDWSGGVSRSERGVPSMAGSFQRVDIAIPTHSSAILVSRDSAYRSVEIQMRWPSPGRRRPGTV